MIADTEGLRSIPAAISPITEYGIPNETAIGCRWNILQPFDTFLLEGSRAGRARQADLRRQHAPHGRRDAGTAGRRRSHAIQTYLSAPGRDPEPAYYLKPQK